MLDLSLPVVVAVAALLQTSAAQATRPVPAPADATSDAARGEAALGENDWAHAIEFFSRAQNGNRLAPAILIGLGTAHAHAGHELAAIAWLRSYLAVSAGSDPRRSQALDQVIRLQVVAETRIRRVLEEGAEAVEEIGALDPASAGAVRRLTVQAALVNGDPVTAQATALGVDDGSRDQLWTDVASALASDEDLEHAVQAALNIVDPQRHAQVTSSIQQELTAASARPISDRWETLARQLSGRPEIVDLDRMLAEIARAAPGEVPVRLLEVGTRLRGAYERIQQLSARQRAR